MLRQSNDQNASFGRVRTVFHRVYAVSLPERAAALDRECDSDPELRSRVESLLRAFDEAGEFLPEGDGAGQPASLNSEHRPVVGRAEVGEVLSGKYALAGRIGEGGMGEVWEADQLAPVRRRVAVKLIRPGLHSWAILERFEAERQVLALMDHPNVARVLDGGSTDAGQPYFVMELIAGEPITTYCDDRQLGIRERLALFARVCEAVQHAHQRGIIHRDLKPGNVLVETRDGEPVPKVIDFGLAKLLAPVGRFGWGSDTKAGTILGTPQYMAPEQVCGDPAEVDTRTDVYALGAILYELLTGSPPLAAEWAEADGLEEMVRLVRQGDPPPPSARLSGVSEEVARSRRTNSRALADALRGDLDCIALKSLDKERGRRYETANDFSRDVKRYLAGEPVTAHLPSVAYRLRKFVGRNRVPVVAAAGILLALLAGTVGSTLGLLRAEQKRGEAEQAKEEEARQRRAADHERALAVEFRNRALGALHAATNEDVGKLLGSRQTFTANERAYLDAIALRWQAFARQEGTDEQSRAIQAQGHFQVAHVCQILGRREEARREYELALVLREKLVEEFPTVPEYRRELAGIHHNLGLLMRDSGRRAEAEKQFRQALALREDLVSESPAVPDYRHDLAASGNSLGNVLRDLGRWAKAEEQFRLALARQEKLVAEFHSVPRYRHILAMIQNNLGRVLDALGRRTEAEEQYRQAIARQEELVAEFPDAPEYRRELAGDHHNLGTALQDWGMEEAEKQHRLALAIREKLAAEYPAVLEYRQDLASSHTSLGRVLHGMGITAGAEEEYHQAQAIWKKLVAEFPAVPEFRRCQAGGHTGLGNLMKDLGRMTVAEEEYNRALEIREKLVAEFPTVPDYRGELAVSHCNLGVLLARKGQRTQAEKRYRQELAIREELVAEFPAAPDFRQELALCHHNLGNLSAELGQWEEAEKQHRQALTIREKLVAEFPSTLGYRVHLGASYTGLGLLIRDGSKTNERLAWLQKAVDTLHPILEKEPRHLMAKLSMRNACWGRAQTYHQLKKYAEAMENWDRAIELSSKLEQPQFRAFRASSKLGNGQVTEAVAEVAELRKLSGWPVNHVYDFARVYSVASSQNSDQKQEYADQAMILLQRAVKGGWKEVSLLKTDPDLDPLRERSDFKKLLVEVDAQAVPKAEVLPAPRRE